MKQRACGCSPEYRTLMFEFFLDGKVVVLGGGGWMLAWLIGPVGQKWKEGSSLLTLKEIPKWGSKSQAESWLPREGC